MFSKDVGSGNLIRLFPRASCREQGPPGTEGDVDDTVVMAHLRQLELRGQTPDTVYCRRRALARLAAALGKALLDATEQDLISWRHSLSVGPATIVGYVSHAREFYRWAVAAGLTDSNPAAGLPVPRLPRRVPRPIGERDLFAAVAGAPPRIRPWLALAGWCGLRAREIALLRRESVLERRQPPVLLVTADATKGRTERIVPLHEYVLEELAEAGLPRQGWVFRRHDGQPGPNRPWTISHLCNRYLHEAGHPETLHSLRHRYATVTYQDSRDLLLVQGLLGHAQPSTTAGYARWDQGAASDVVSRIPAPRHLKVVSE